MKKTYTEVQKEAAKKYDMIINPFSKCRWTRMHVHYRTRMICKWNYRESLESTFDLFHEIGHCENNKMSMRICEREYYASVWAAKTLLSDYGIKLDSRIIKRYADYIDHEKRKGMNRGGKNYGELNFTKYCSELYTQKGVQAVWLVSVIILFISLKIGEYINSGATDVRDWTGTLAQADRFRKIIINKEPENLSPQWVAKYRQSYGWEYDAWYKDWLEQHRVTWKLKDNKYLVKIESEKEIEYWTKKYTLSDEDFQKWMQDKWRDKYVCDLSHWPYTKVVPIETREDWTGIPHYTPLIIDMRDSPYASEFLYE